MDFNSENDAFDKLLNTCIIQENLNVEMIEKYVKYITKD